jgi:hypothetical protein
MQLFCEQTLIPILNITQKLDQNFFRNLKPKTSLHLSSTCHLIPTQKLLPTAAIRRDTQNLPPVWSSNSKQPMSAPDMYTRTTIQSKHRVASTTTNCQYH